MEWVWTVSCPESDTKYWKVKIHRRSALHFGHWAVLWHHPQVHMSLLYTSHLLLDTLAQTVLNNQHEKCYFMICCEGNTSSSDRLNISTFHFFGSVPVYLLSDIKVESDQIQTGLLNIWWLISAVRESPFVHDASAVCLINPPWYYNASVVGKLNPSELIIKELSLEEVETSSCVLRGSITYVNNNRIYVWRSWRRGTVDMLSRVKTRQEQRKVE